MSTSDWARADGEDDTEVVHAQPTPGNGAREGIFDFKLTGKRLTGGDRGGSLKACGAIQIGKPCTDVTVSDKFSDFLMETLGKCVPEGLSAEGKSGKYSKIIVSQMGTYVNRRARGSKSLSMHATGRAIDISRFDITLDNGQSFDINMTRQSKERPFYKKFVACWREANATRCAQHSIGRMGGAVDSNYNKAHYSHVHLSMPFCPRQRGIAGA